MKIALGFRARLALPLVAAAGVLLGAIVWQSLDERDHLRRDAAETLLHKAKLIASRQQSLLARTDATVSSMMLRPEFRPGTATSICASELREIIALEPEFNQIGLARADGEIVCAAMPPDGRANVADQAWFRQALQSRTLVVSDVVSRRTLGKPVILLAKAIRNTAGRVDGVVYVSIDLTWLHAELGQPGLPTGARLWVIDHQGGIALRYPDPEGWVGRNVATIPSMQHFLSPDNEGVLQAIGLDGVPRLFGYATLLNTQSGRLRLFLTVPKAVVEAPADQRFLKNLAIMLGVLALVAALLAGSFYRLLMRPLAILARTAASLGAGNLDARSGLRHSDDEIGQLAKTLDDAITERKRVEADLSLAASVYLNTQEGIVVTDAAAMILSVNPAFSEITGYTAEEALGRKPSLLRSAHHTNEFYRDMWQALLSQGRWQGEIWNRRKSGDLYLEWMTISAVLGDDGKPMRYVSVFHDITEMRRKDEHIRHLAFHDVLTGLPNRALFQERLEHAIERARRQGSRLSVTFLDLDGFKHVNDSHGHDVGDLLLQGIAERIRAHLRRGVDTVARLGGDEFVVLMEDLKGAEQCAFLADEIIADIARPLELRGQSMQVGASMGIAFFPEDGGNVQQLMQRADIAMYAAKLAGKGTYRVFHADMLDVRGTRHPR